MTKKRWKTRLKEWLVELITGCFDFEAADLVFESEHRDEICHVAHLIAVLQFDKSTESQATEALENLVAKYGVTYREVRRLGTSLRFAVFKTRQRRRTRVVSAEDQPSGDEERRP